MTKWAIYLREQRAQQREQKMRTAA